MTARDVGVVTCVLVLRCFCLLSCRNLGLCPDLSYYSVNVSVNSRLVLCLFHCVFYFQFHSIVLITINILFTISNFMYRSVFCKHQILCSFFNCTSWSQILSNVAASPHSKFEDSPPSESEMSLQGDCAPPQKATVKSLAAGSRSATLNDARIEIVERIKKCLARGNHANANENEAKSAIKMASKIMQQHNITQAQVMEGEDDAQRLERGGMSTVKIGPRTQYHQMNFEPWVPNLQSAICMFFDCQAFCIRSPASIEWTFFGVAENTVSGAMAFEMAYNLIQSWAWPLEDVCARDSYCLGVAHGLKNIAILEKRAAERAAKENEAKSTAAETEWASSMQLTSYRENIAKIAEDVLRANNLKPNPKKEKLGIKDKKQYSQGVKDSKKINVRGARIENGRS